MSLHKENTSPIIYAPAPRRKERYFLRSLILLGIGTVGLFIYWYIQPSHWGHSWLFGLLSFSLFFKVLRVLHEWYHYYSIGTTLRPSSHREWKVDMLTTACPGEPYGMIVETLEAMVAVRYPHTNYLCDEGDDPYLKEVCQRLGVVHVTRSEKIDAKAGNINNALKQATGEICVVLDPDHVPHPEYLDRVLPYFEDEKIGYVQVVQPYKNQGQSWVAKGAAEQTYHFYGPMMMAMNEYGTVQAIGANCTFRRSALDSIGGHAAGLSEDMHTAMRLHAKGWRSVYVPEVLTRGLVPNTLSAYYKQQLKWSRGTFDLLFYKVPQLFKHFSWRQKLHYLTLPLYFFFGFVTLVDYLLPIVALVTQNSPLYMEGNDFVLYMVPMLLFTLLIRQYSQRWVMEKQERGFHLTGGVLYSATWWVFIVGFVYTIFKVKVPYIPTPKDDQAENEWRLSLPSLAMSLIGIGAIGYGLYWDWTPYSLMMAGFVGVNVVIFFWAFLMGQQKTLNAVGQAFHRLFSEPVKQAFWRITAYVEDAVYFLLREWAFVWIAALSLVIFSFSEKEESEMLTPGTFAASGYQSVGGFYMGVRTNDNGTIPALPEVNGVRTNMVAERISFRDTQSVDQARTFLAECREKDVLPLLIWEITDSLPAIDHQTLPEPVQLIINEIKQFEAPVLINLSAESAESSPAHHHNLWQEMFLATGSQGVNNITWVWTAPPTDWKDFYPGDRYVDWVSLDTRSDSLHLEDRYNALASLNKPIMLQRATVSRKPATSEITQLLNGHHPLLRGVVWSSDDFYRTDFREQLEALAPRAYAQPYYSVFNQKNFPQKQNRIQRNGSKFTLQNQDTAFYIKGVSYNLEHDWRDHHIPLTRKKLEQDFSAIREMGGNTIRRYNPTPYDRNILRVAEEKDINVLYGFWFDPQIDYLMDSSRIQEYREDVIREVSRYQDASPILAWGIGNETWGLLKKRFAEPYLTIVRRNYANFIEELAQEIHRIDPRRPVFTTFEHLQYQTEGALVSFRENAPSLDFIGVNSYYQDQISTLHHIATSLDPERPYLISEFGPKGYWDTSLSDFRRDTLLAEACSHRKSEWYAEQWNHYVAPFQGDNLGGVAFCWGDRLEGSATWFGITDDTGRRKPAYYALKSAWTGAPTPELPDVHILANWYETPRNKKVTYRARITNDYLGKLTYRWYLYNEEPFSQYQALPSEDRAVTFEVPDREGSYRLYMHAYDTLNNVITSSHPIIVKQ